MKKADYIRWCQRQNLNLKKDVFDHLTKGPWEAPLRKLNLNLIVSQWPSQLIDEIINA